MNDHQHTLSPPSSGEGYPDCGVKDGGAVRFSDGPPGGYGTFTARSRRITWPIVARRTVIFGGSTVTVRNSTTHYEEVSDG